MPHALYFDDSARLRVREMPHPESGGKLITFADWSSLR